MKSEMQEGFFQSPAVRYHNGNPNCNAMVLVSLIRGMKSIDPFASPNMLFKRQLF